MELEGAFDAAMASSELIDFADMIRCTFSAKRGRQRAVGGKTADVLR
jgi:hypothetical protein